MHEQISPIWDLLMGFTTAVTVFMPGEKAILNRDLFFYLIKYSVYLDINEVYPNVRGVMMFERLFGS